MKYRYSLGFIRPGNEIDPNNVMRNARIISVQPGEQHGYSGFWLFWEIPVSDDDD